METPPPTERYPQGRATLQTELRQARKINLKPPPRLTLSQWADKHAVLSSETSAQTGRFRAYAYQRGIQDAFTDPSVTQVSVMKSARVGYTKIIDHVVGYYLHQDPSPILVVQPRVEDAEDYSKSEIEPMLRDIQVLADITGDPKAKSSKQTILKKSFLNGSSLRLTGANSPGGFRRITVRLALFDEIDGYPVNGAGTEGDQIKLGIKRTETFWNRKIGAGSTPTIKGDSRIEKLYEASDQRRYYVPCPHCGTMQPLEWGGPDTPHGIKWDKDAAGNGLSETAHYICVHGCVIDETEKPVMIDRGEWIAAKPSNGHAGFHIWAGYSLNVNASWACLVKEWLEVKNDPLQRQTFINLVLGEPYEDRGDKALTANRLQARSEIWAGEVPTGVAIVTAGVDIQDDRAELEFVGWGRNEESWSIAHEVVEGDPETPEFWDRIDALLKRQWLAADGTPFVTKAVCMDSGGHHTQKVYEFSKARLGRNVWAVKGESARGGARSPVWPTKRPSKRNKQSFRPIILGVNAAKDVIRARLFIDKPEPGYLGPVPQYMHFPADRDIGYFEQLTSERLLIKQIGGQRYRVWELPPGKANEALDMRVYAYAALCGLIHRGLKLNRLAESLGIPTDDGNPLVGTSLPTELVDGEPEAMPAPAVVPKRPDPVALRKARLKKLVSRMPH